MAIIVSIILIIAYCVYDRMRTNNKQKVKALEERIDSLEKRVASCEENICDMREGACSSTPLPGQSNDSND